MSACSRRAALTCFSMLASAAGATADEPSVWITLGSGQLAALKQSMPGDGWRDRLDRFETRDGVTVARVPERSLAELSRALHNRFHRCGGFVAHPSHQAALAALGPAPDFAPAASYTIDNGPVVRALLAEVQEANVLDTIRSLSSFPTRFYTSPTGVESARWLRDLWRGWAQGRDDVTVELFPHPGWPQPSVVMTIEGATIPEQVVVIGGHLDSITDAGNAPGADDDASGVAALGEAARAALATGYRPARTVKFIAYAAEEVGLRGSQEIARAFRDAGVDVAGVLQLDMTAFQGPSFEVALITDHTSAAQNQFVRDLIDTYLQLRHGDGECGYGCSDHAAWTAAGFASTFTFEALPDETQGGGRVHTSRDTIESFGGSAGHAVKFARIAAAYMAELAKGSLAAPGAAVELFQHCDFAGWSARFTGAGSFGTAEILARGGRDDDASSIRVPAGFRVTLYDGDGQSGRSLALTADAPCFVAGGFNDVLSSLRVERTGGAEPGVVFFQHRDFGGAAGRPLAPGSYTLSQLQALGVPNDWVSSVRIPAGRTLTMYQHDGFGGTSWTLAADTPSFTALTPNANDQMSSCRVQ